MFWLRIAAIEAWRQRGQGCRRRTGVSCSYRNFGEERAMSRSARSIYPRRFPCCPPLRFCLLGAIVAFVSHVSSSTCCGQNVGAELLLDLSGGNFNGAGYTQIAHAPGRPNDLFVARQDGNIYAYRPDHQNAEHVFHAARAADDRHWPVLGTVGIHVRAGLRHQRQLVRPRGGRSTESGRAPGRRLASSPHLHPAVHSQQSAFQLADAQFDDEYPALGSTWHRPQRRLDWISAGRPQHAVDHQRRRRQRRRSGRDMLRTGQDPSDLLSVASCGSMCREPAPANSAIMRFPATIRKRPASRNTAIGHRKCGASACAVPGAAASTA